MKMLNWLHRKLHLNTNYSQVSQKNGDVTDAYVGDEGKMVLLEQDTEALLLQEVLNGILTIGTLGHNHALAHRTSCETDKEEEPALEELEDEEVVIQADEKYAIGHAAVGAVGGAGQQPLRVVELTTIKARISLEGKSVAAAPVVPETEEILELPLLMEEKEKLGRRTTLADLFAAESINQSTAADQGEKVFNANKYVRIINSSGQEQGTADQKKLMKQQKKNKGEQKPLSTAASSSTSKKFQKLITRVLKKKIHPADMAPVAAAAPKEIICADQKPHHGIVRAPWLHASE